MGEREDRIARNEALFRSVNERVRDLATRSPTVSPEPVSFVCECGRSDCAGSLILSLEAYEQVRAEPTQFMVAPGHDVASVERIVERRGTYDVVRKLDDEARIAIETDPRS